MCPFFPLCFFFFFNDTATTEIYTLSLHYALPIWRRAPPTAIVPMRTKVLVLALTLNPIVPTPVPEPPDVMVIHAVDGTAFHAHPEPVVTSTVFAPPAAAIDMLAGLKASAQLRPLWLTLNVCPPMVIVPARTVVPGFDAIVYATVPGPLPLAPESIVIQTALLVVV